MKTFKEHVDSLLESGRRIIQRRSLPNSGKYYYGALYNSTPDATHNMTPDTSTGGDSGGGVSS